MFPNALYRDAIEATAQNVRSGMGGTCPTQPLGAQRGLCSTDVTVASADGQCLDGLDPGSLTSKACGDTETPAVVPKFHCLWQGKTDCSQKGKCE